MLRSRVVISELAYDVLWDYLGFEVAHKHRALQGPSPGATWEQRKDLVKQVTAELQRAKLAFGDDPHPDLLDTLRLLHKPHRELYGWFSAITGSFSVLAASSGDHAVRAMLGDGQLTLEPIAAYALGQAVADALPEHPPLRASTLSFPADALDDPAQASSGFDSGYLRPAGDHGTRADSTVYRARELLAKPATGNAQFFSAVRDQLAGYRRCEFPVNAYDTAEGRFLTQQQKGHDRRPWLTITPADRRALAARLQQLISD